jgi:hypothetical protein
LARFFCLDPERSSPGITAWEQERQQRQQQVRPVQRQEQQLRLQEQREQQQRLAQQQRELRQEQEQERQQVPLLFCRKRTEQRRPAGW